MAMAYLGPDLMSEYIQYSSMSIKIFNGIRYPIEYSFYIQ